MLPAFRHAVETSRFREHPEGEAGDRDSGMGMKVVSKQTIGVPRYPEKNKNEAPPNDENLYDGTVFARVFLKKIPHPFVLCFWMFLALYPQQFLYYEPDIGGYYVKGPTLQLLVQLLNWPSPQVDPGSQPDH